MVRPSLGRPTTRGRSSRRRRSAADAKSQRYEGLLQSFDAAGKSREKRWIYERLGSHGQSKSVIRFTAPAEVKGVALLIVNHPDRASDQWMWTPALERDRRIALQDRSTRFFGTDFSFEDLEERDVDQYDYTLLGEEAVDGAACWQIESTPKQAQSSQYTPSIVWIRKDNYALGPDRFFVKDDVVRRLNYRDIQQRAGHLDRPRARDDRPAARQPHAAGARQDRIQRAAEGRGLHAAGAPPQMRSRSSSRCCSRAGPPRAGAQAAASYQRLHRGPRLRFSADDTKRFDPARRRRAVSRRGVLQADRVVSVGRRPRLPRQLTRPGRRTSGGSISRIGAASPPRRRSPPRGHDLRTGVHRSISASSSFAGAGPTSSTRPIGSRRGTILTSSIPSCCRCSAPARRCRSRARRSRPSGCRG